MNATSLVIWAPHATSFGGESAPQDYALALTFVPANSVLLTGATGYIASHVATALAEQGYTLTGVDNLSNSSPQVANRLETLIDGPFEFVQADIRDTSALANVMRANDIDAVIHLAGSKAVGESVSDPLAYYDNNVAGSISLMRAMAEVGVHELVFSSSATVYAPDQPSPLSEQSRLGPINPYGRTKLMIEHIINDTAATSPLRAVNLRYFNPIGAHPSGAIGEDPVGTPNNLMPFIMQVASGRRPELVVFGDDYDTPDGTCIRDYIHVMDLADGHVAALRLLESVETSETINLGTGHGSSVTEVLQAAERAVDAPIPHRVSGRRDGDGAVSFADPTRARELMGWTAERTLDEACRDHWRWQDQNPMGFGSSNPDPSVT